MGALQALGAGEHAVVTWHLSDSLGCRVAIHLGHEGRVHGFLVKSVLTFAEGDRLAKAQRRETSLSPPPSPLVSTR